MTIQGRFTQPNMFRSRHQSRSVVKWTMRNVQEMWWFILETVFFWCFSACHMNWTSQHFPVKFRDFQWFNGLLGNLPFLCLLGWNKEGRDWTCVSSNDFGTGRGSQITLHFFQSPLNSKRMCTDLIIWPCLWVADMHIHASGKYSHCNILKWLFIWVWHFIQESLKLQLNLKKLHITFLELLGVKSSRDCEILIQI